MIQSGIHSSSALPTPSAVSAAERTPWAGIALAVGVAAAATLLSHLPVWPFTDAQGRHPLEPVLLSIGLGLLVGNVRPLSPALKPGVKFAAKRLLALGIILLGARLDFGALLKVGAVGLLMSACVVVAAFALFAVLTPLLRLSRIEGLLLAVGTAICGGTAIVAVAPLLRAKEETVVLSVATVTLLGLAGMFLLPPLASYLALTPWQFGVWTGLTIHQTPQVIAAGFSHGAEAGQTATVIKLARVCLLAPIAFLIGVRQARSEPGRAAFSLREACSLVPAFILGFLAMALARTLGLIPDIDFRWQTTFSALPFTASVSLKDALIECASFLLATGMAAVGLETSFSALRRMSLRPVAAATLASLVIGGAALLVLRLL